MTITRICFLDGVSLRMRRPSGAQAGADAGGLRRSAGWNVAICWPFCAARARARRTGRACSQDLYRRGLEGKKLLLILTDGCPGLGGGDPTVYPRVRASALLGA